MKAFLMHRDRDFDAGRDTPPNEAVLTQDLELSTLLDAMAAGDPFLFEVARRALLLSLRDPDAVVYRQEVLKDCLENPGVVRELYALAAEAIRAEKSVWGGLYRDSPRSMLSSSVQKMDLLVGFLRRLRDMTDRHAGKFRSEGCSRFFAMIAEELDEDYFALIEGYLKELKFKGGPLISARLAPGNRGTGYTLRRARDQGFIGRLFDRSGYSFSLPERDEAGARALSELEDRGLNLVAKALMQSVEHVHSFFIMLMTEIGFYVACVNVREPLARKAEPITFPQMVSREHLTLSAKRLYDVCLTLTIDEPAVPNDLVADDKSLVMITGANQGGKSTFLRSLGLAQLMAQCGMFVAAESFRANVCDGVFTHYKREEDDSMESGKLDEELARMSAIAGQITPHSILLCNESFASTNEREGSEIARHVVDALLHEHIKVVFVTHMFDLAQGFHERRLSQALFLRAERGSDGARPFRLSEGEPLPTSYGEDSYRKIFGRAVEPTPAAATDG
jgi:MutS domain V